MQNQRPIYNHLPRLGKSTPSAQKTIGHQPKKIRIRSIKSIRMGIKARLSPTISLLPLTQIGFRPKPSKNVMAVIEKAMQSLRSIPLRLPRKKKTRLRT